MVETKTITWGILGVLLVAGLGTTYMLTREQLDNVYICPTNNVTGMFERLSSTNKTGYWTVNGTQKQSLCSGNTWMKLERWCTINNINCTTFIDQGITVVSNTTIDEDGAVIYAGGNVVVDKSMKLNVNGTIITIDYKSSIKCICDKATGCKITECLQ